MNTQTGKSVGIALLLAAGLLAVLFAFGVFAPAGVDAGVELGDKAPTAKALSGTTGTKLSAGGEAGRLVVEFEVNDTVDGQTGTVAELDDVLIVVPGDLIAAPTADFTATSVTVKQGNTDVGSVSFDPEAGATDPDANPSNGLTIRISEAGSGGTNLAAGEKTTVTINGITFADAPAGADVTIQQLPSQGKAEVTVGLFNRAETFTAASAKLVGGNLVVEFTARRTHAAGYNVIITPNSDHFSATSTIADATVSVASAPADSVGTAVSVTGANGAATVIDYDDDAKITVTISGLGRAFGYDGDQMVKIAEGTHYSLNLTVGDPSVSGPAGEDDRNNVSGEVFGTTAGKPNNKADAGVQVSLKALLAGTNDLQGGGEIVITLPRVPDSRHHRLGRDSH